MKRGLKLCLGAAAIALLALQLLLPVMAGQLLTAAVRQLTGSQDAAAVATAQPAILMLTGSFDRLQLTANHAVIDKVTFSHIDMELTQAHLDMTKLFLERRVVLDKAQTATVTAELTGADLADYLNRQVKGVKNAAVEIGETGIVVKADVAIGGLVNVAVTLHGKLINEQQKIKFVTERFLLNNIVTGNITGSSLGEFTLLETGSLPFHVKLDSIQQETGKIMIHLSRRD